MITFFVVCSLKWHSKYDIIIIGDNMKKVMVFDNEYDVIKDKEGCFDSEEFTNLVTDYFKPYDYILGDYSYGKLRLKGFYADNSKNANAINKYSYLEEYINNYCAFNCKYFLLQKIKK